MSDFDNLDHFEHAFSDTLLGPLLVLDQEYHGHVGSADVQETLAGCE
ncbi:MAG: hypothetical protein HY744_31590 [Deltaproteobacteria bacterium]|nr:hypothetical protein [Deltaproteobacteria bacterium]